MPVLAPSRPRRLMLVVGPAPDRRLPDQPGRIVGTDGGDSPDDTDGVSSSSVLPTGSPASLGERRRHPKVEHLRKLPVAEKLRVVEELWDDIGQFGESFPLPDWQRVEVERRVAELEANPVIALSREELWRRVRVLPLASASCLYSRSQNASQRCLKGRNKSVHPARIVRPMRPRLVSPFQGWCSQSSSNPGRRYAATPLRSGLLCGCPCGAKTCGSRSGVP